MGMLDLNTKYSIAQAVTSTGVVLPASFTIDRGEIGSVDLTTTMLGTGPYLVADHRQDESWTFTANPDWHGGDNLAVQTLELQIVDQESTRQAALREGSTGMAKLEQVSLIPKPSEKRIPARAKRSTCALGLGAPPVT